MLRRDDELRLSDAVQRRYARCGDDGEAKERVTHAVQRQVVREAGFHNTAEGVATLQGALSLFPNDAELVEAAFYLRNNINMPCPIQLGRRVPQLPLHELSATASGSVCLRSLCSRAPLTVLAAGSAT